MHGAIDPGGFKDVILFLATAAIVAPLFQRLRLRPILGLLVSIVPGTRYIPVERPADIAQLAEFGVVFLLFMIGLELSWERLRLMRRLVFGLGAGPVGGTTAVIALAAGLAGLPPAAALTIGAGLALSSTAIVMPVLAEHKRL